MSDLIRVVDLEIRARIGVPEAERAQPQRLLVTLEMSVPSIARAALVDNVDLTVDYAKVAARVRELAEARPRRLIETLAEDLAAALLHDFAVTKLTVEIKKFILPETRYVAVKIERPTS